jgi:hypothetical protein
MFDHLVRFHNSPRRDESVHVGERISEKRFPRSSWCVTIASAQERAERIRGDNGIIETETSYDWNTYPERESNLNFYGEQVHTIRESQEDRSDRGSEIASNADQGTIAITNE